MLEKVLDETVKSDEVPKSHLESLSLDELTTIELAPVEKFIDQYPYDTIEQVTGVIQELMTLKAPPCPEPQPLVEIPAPVTAESWWHNQLSYV